MRTCDIGPCQTKHHALGMCIRHYARFDSHGDTSEPFLRRLWDRIAPRGQDGCWVWEGAKDRLGYGRVGRDGKTSLIHREVYELLVGPIPDGLELDHLCRNPPCCNPDHLEPVTHRENVLRGDAAIRPDRCKHGHDLTNPENVYRHTRGRTNRKCKPCALRRSREAHKRKKENKHV